MGRCYSATKSYNAGDLLFEEEALVFAHYEEHTGYDKKIKNLFFKAFPKTVINKLEEIVDELSHLDNVQSLDTGRNFLQLIALTILRQQKEVDALSDFSGAVDEPDLSLKLHLLDSLTAANLKQCIQDVKQFRKSYPKVIPKYISDTDAGKLLGVLNTNQLELEEFGGSGLFVATAIAEHSCEPNSSFTTSGHKLYMAVIRDIQPGDRISIDYGNNFYSPTADRIESLRESYEFTCVCPACLGPDRKRAFFCPNPSCRGTGLVYPIGTGMGGLAEGDGMDVDDGNFTEESCKSYR
jgi:SET and MYND domain-containing protein